MLVCKIGPDYISGFRGAYGFLSNFHYCPVPFCRRVFPTAEHAYQAHKSKKHKERDHVLTLATPLEAKKYGRALELRSDWQTIMVPLMDAIVLAKFKNNKAERELLLATGDKRLIHRNDHGDVFWGKIEKPDGHLIGADMLGRALMKARDELR